LSHRTDPIPCRGAWVPRTLASRQNAAPQPKHRGLKTPEFLIIDGAAGLEKALAALWPEVPTQRCTVHKHRNLLAHAPDHLHEEVSPTIPT
jgi:transposase-like protein